MKCKGLISPTRAEPKQRKFKENIACLFQCGPGSVRFGGGMFRAVPVFVSGGSSGQRVFLLPFSIVRQRGTAPFSVPEI